jgi:hypothetical protein
MARAGSAARPQNLSSSSSASEVLLRALDDLSAERGDDHVARLGGWLSGESTEIASFRLLRLHLHWSGQGEARLRLDRADAGDGDAHQVRDLRFVGGERDGGRLYGASSAEGARALSLGPQAIEVGVSLAGD